MTSELTARQKSVLDFIFAFQQQHGMSPTVREIGGHLGLSAPAGIHRILNVLKDKGYLTAEPGKNRSWRFHKEMTGCGIPLVSRIAAGYPLEAIENFEEELAISPALFGCENCFGLRVKGDSMIDSHIMDGDLAIIRPQARVENGAIAAVMVQDLLDEATLKIVRYTPTSLRLKPANRAYKTMVFKGRKRSRVKVLGKLVGVVRRA